MLLLGCPHSKRKKSLKSVAICNRHIRVLRGGQEGVSVLRERRFENGWHLRLLCFDILRNYDRDLGDSWGYNRPMLQPLVLSLCKLKYVLKLS